MVPNGTRTYYVLWIVIGTTQLLPIWYVAHFRLPRIRFDVLYDRNSMSSHIENHMKIYTYLSGAFAIFADPVPWNASVVCCLDESKLMQPFNSLAPLTDLSP